MIANQSNVARLYCECHITIEPVFGDRLAEVETLAKKYGFRVASLLMQKREEDTPERSKYDTFCTGTSKYYSALLLRAVGLVNLLQERGYKVWRTKIEDTLLDTKYGDILK